MSIITTNKKASFEYHILETLEAGIVLTGDEIKSIRQKTVSLNEAFATPHNGEIRLINCFIGPYSHAYTKEDTARRSRTLLLSKRDIMRLIGEVSRKGVTLIPLKLYFKKRWVKVSLGICKHKKTVDKRHDIKERDLARQAAREIKERF